jgi:hypothetical protein
MKTEGPPSGTLLYWLHEEFISRADIQGRKWSVSFCFLSKKCNAWAVFLICALMGHCFVLFDVISQPGNLPLWRTASAEQSRSNAPQRRLGTQRR